MRKLTLSSEQTNKIKQIITYLDNLDNKLCKHAASHLKAIKEKPIVIIDETLGDEQSQ